MQEKQITKRAIAESFQRLLEQRSFASITVEDISKEASISRRTFYRHFADKYELLNWIYDCDMEIQARGEEVITSQDYLKEICCIFYKNKLFYKKAFMVEGQNSLCEYCQNQLCGVVRNDFPPKDSSENLYTHMLNYFTKAICDAIRLWIMDERDMLSSSFAEELWKSTAVFGVSTL